MNSRSVFSKPVGGVTIGAGTGKGAVAGATTVPSSGLAAPKPSPVASGPITTALVSTATFAKKPSLKELLAQQQQLSGGSSANGGTVGSRDVPSASASLGSTFSAGTRPMALSKTPVSQSTPSATAGSSATFAPVKPREFAPEAAVAPSSSQPLLQRSTGGGQQPAPVAAHSAGAGPTRPAPNNAPAAAPARKVETKTATQEQQQVIGKSAAAGQAASPAKRSATTAMTLLKNGAPVADDKPSSSATSHFTTMPATRAFPNPIPEPVLRIINGRTLEKPFTTEDSKVFPPRGIYCCVRCRTPIAAAVAKVPCDVGYSGFRSFHTKACRVTVVVGDESSNLHVTCAECSAFLGILTQDIPQSAAALCTNNEMLKVNSCALWLVDGNADAVDGLQNNHFTASTDATSAHDQGYRHISAPSATAPGNSSGAVGATRDDDDDDDNSGDDLLAVTDFDSLDVIGTTDGAELATRRRREQRACWRRGSATAHKPSVKASPAVLVAPVHAVPDSSIGKSISTQQRRQLAEEAMNVHSDESEPPSSNDDSEDDEGSATD